jgi:hypothetical protein
MGALGNQSVAEQAGDKFSMGRAETPQEGKSISKPAIRRSFLGGCDDPIDSCRPSNHLPARCLGGFLNQGAPVTNSASKNPTFAA